MRQLVYNEVTGKSILSDFGDTMEGIYRVI